MLLIVAIRVLTTAGVLLLMPQFIPGIEVSGYGVAVVVALVWGVLTLVVRPVLTLLTLPITLITFGLFSFVLNAFLFWCLNFIQGFSVHGFVPAFMGSLVLAAASFLLHRLLD